MVVVVGEDDGMLDGWLRVNDAQVRNKVKLAVSENRMLYKVFMEKYLAAKLLYKQRYY